MEYVLVIAIAILFFILLGIFIFKTDFTRIESPEKRAGRQGEQFASQLIYEILDEEDVLLKNVRLNFEGKETELDNVIINHRGVFVIEVKNYSGTLIGDEDDYEWIKNKFTYAGNFNQKSVKNPIKQVKRQVYILSNYLKQYGLDVWVEGYVFLVERNSPVESGYVLDTQKDINTALHFGTNNNLTKSMKEKIVELLS